MISRQNNSGFFAGLELVSNFILANFIWVVFSMTIIGMPLATVGLFAMMSQLIKGRQPEFFKVFVGTIRQKWAKALAFGMVDLIAGGLIVVNLVILSQIAASDIMGMFSRSLTVFSGILLIISNIYIWFLLANVDLPLKAVIKLGLFLVLTYPLRSILMATLTLIPVFLTALLPAFFILFITVSTTIYIGSRGAWMIIEDHFSVQELEELGLLPRMDHPIQ